MRRALEQHREDAALRRALLESSAQRAESSATQPEEGLGYDEDSESSGEDDAIVAGEVACAAASASSASAGSAATTSALLGRGDRELALDSVVEVLSFLDAESCGSCAMLSRRWGQVAVSDTLWRMVCSRTFRGPAYSRVRTQRGDSMGRPARQIPRW